MADTGARALARRRAKALAAGRKPGKGRSAFDRSLAHLCWQLGLSHERTAWVMGRSVGEVRHEWSVLTGLPLEEDPKPEDIEREAAAIRSEWSPETFQAAESGIRHDSSCRHRGDKRCHTTNSRATAKRPERSRGCERSTALQPAG